MIRNLTFCILAAAAAMTAVPASAQDSSLTIAGTIPEVCEIFAPADVSGLNLDSAGSQSIGSVNIKCNSAEGYTTTLVSGNGGKLASGDAANTTTFDYQLSVGGLGEFSVPPGGVAFSTNDGDPGILTAATPEGRNYAVSLVNLRRTGPAFSGAYSDTLTFSIVAK